MTKRKVTRDELQRLGKELLAFPTTEQGKPREPPDEDRLAEMAEEVEALARDLKQPHVSDADLAEE